MLSCFQTATIKRASREPDYSRSVNPMRSHLGRHLERRIERHLAEISSEGDAFAASPDMAALVIDIIPRLRNPDDEVIWMVAGGP